MPWRMVINYQLVSGLTTITEGHKRRHKRNNLLSFAYQLYISMKNYSQFSVILQNWLIASHCRPWIDFTIDHLRESCCVISSCALPCLLNCHYSCHFIRTGVTFLYFFEVYLSNSALMALRKCNCSSLNCVTFVSTARKNEMNESVKHCISPWRIPRACALTLAKYIKYMFRLLCFRRRG